MAYQPPLADFVSSSLSGAITAASTTATIGAGLNIPSTNGILQINYDSTIAVGLDNGPETVSYATYNSGTGALTGLARGLAGTTAVAHANTASVSCGPSSLYFQQSPQYDTWNAAGTLTYASVDGPTQTATIAGDSTTVIYPGVRLKYEQTQAIQNYWTFNTNSADSKGSATMGNIGTPTYTAGKFGNALTLNGIDQALSITDSAAFKPTGEFTIGCWFKTSNTGAAKAIFQSWAQNTNFYGIYLAVSSGNVLNFQVANNSASPSSLTGTTTVTDGNFHYVVVSVRNNFTQVYLDGKLEVSGYTITPGYNATNYVRIGCLNNTGSNSTWFNGQIDDLFIAAYALDEQTIKAKYDAATAQGTGDLTLTKYALVTASSYSAPNTTVTIYSGTDHTMMNSTISNAYYSTQKAPYGFPLDESKWTVEIVGTSSSQNAPVSGNWYNVGGTFSVPIGRWRVGFDGFVYGNRGVSGYIYLGACLSPVNNTAGDSRLNAPDTHTQTDTDYIAQLSRETSMSVPVKRTLYMNIYAGTGGMAYIGIIYNKIYAVSNLL